MAELVTMGLLYAIRADHDLVIEEVSAPMATLLDDEYVGRHIGSSPGVADEINDGTVRACLDVIRTGRPRTAALSEHVGQLIMPSGDGGVVIYLRFLGSVEEAFEELLA